jgi:hypothetical protein
MYPKELAGDLSNMLTTLSHIIARERLSYYRGEMKKAEEIGNDELLKEAIHGTKEAQNLLGATIDLTSIV